MDFGLREEVKLKECVAFKGMNIPREILGNIKYSIATPIQRKVIPKILNGEDLIAISRTGSGKTMAYVIPILMNLLRNREKKTVYTTAKAIIIVPTYELATQVSSVFEELSSGGVHPALFTGMGTVAHSLNYLVVGQFEVAVCTPGRLEHILTEVSQADKNRPIFMKVDDNNVKREISITDGQILKKITEPEIVVIDEMDRIFEDKSLSLSLERILEYFKGTPQYALFSATHHRGNTHIRSILNRKDMDTVEIIGGLSDHLEESRLKIHNLYVQEEMKMAVMISILKMLIYPSDPNNPARILIFVSTCRRCLSVSKAVRSLGVEVAVLNSAESEEAREQAVKSFKTGSISVLVSTDVGCRGLDIRGISAIVEYDYPTSRSTNVHRAGRLNRGKSEKGVVYSFIRRGDIPTYLAFLNHIHAEKPRDKTRKSRLCFYSEKCGVDGNHRNCAYLGLGRVPNSFYGTSQEIARQFADEEDTKSYERYRRSNPPEKVDSKWIVTSVDVEKIKIHPSFGEDKSQMEDAVRKYKARYNRLITVGHQEAAGRIVKNRRKKVVESTVEMDKFKDPSFIPYENIKSNTYSTVGEKGDRSSQIKDRIKKMRKPAGEMFTEWKKENRDRLCKGYLLTRPPAPEEKKEEGERRRKSDGDTVSVKKIYEARKKKEREAERKRLVGSRKRQRNRE